MMSTRPSSLKLVRQRKKQGGGALNLGVKCRACGMVLRSDDLLRAHGKKCRRTKSSELSHNFVEGEGSQSGTNGGGDEPKQGNTKKPNPRQKYLYRLGFFGSGGSPSMPSSRSSVAGAAVTGASEDGRSSPPKKKKLKDLADGERLLVLENELVRLRQRQQRVFKISDPSQLKVSDIPVLLREYKKLLLFYHRVNKVVKSKPKLPEEVAVTAVTHGE